MTDPYDDVDAALRDFISTPSVLFGRAIAAFESIGIEPSIDWDTESFELTDIPQAPGITYGIAMQRSQAIVLHRIHSEVFDRETLNILTPAVVQANECIDVSTVALNETLGMVSLRNAIEIGHMDLGRAALASLFVGAVQRLVDDWEVVITPLLALAHGDIDSNEFHATISERY